MAETARFPARSVHPRFQPLLFHNQTMPATEMPVSSAASVLASADAEGKLQQALSQVTANARRELEAIKLSQLLRPPRSNSSSEFKP